MFARAPGVRKAFLRAKGNTMQRKLTIFYTSDVHGCFSPTDYAGGGETASGLINCMNNFAGDGNTLIIDGGDILQGSPMTYYLYSQRRGGSCVPARLMNTGGYDFVTLGNHDFNYGKTEIERYLGALDAVCLCANTDGIAGVRKTAVVRMENGLRVGLTGVTTQYVTHWEKPENLEGIGVTDAFSAARAALEELKAQDVDLTVCIYHGGYENDPETGEPLSVSGENQGCRICNELDFDILLTGHQHMAAENLRINNTYTCQPPDKAAAYIRMDVGVDSFIPAQAGRNGVAAGRVTARSRLCKPWETPLPEAMDYIRPVEEETGKWLDTPVGHLDVPLTPAEPLDMALNGSLIANFFNQVQLEASGADVSVTSLANTVRGFAKEVTIRDIVSTYIFPNTLVTLELDRTQLKQALERSAEYFDFDAGGRLRISSGFLRPTVQHFNFDYVAGVNVTFDLRRPPGDRVTSILYRGEELSGDRKLTVCMNNYRASGAGGYGVYAGCRVVREQPTEISELIIDYVLRHRDISVDKTKWLRVIY